MFKNYCKKNDITLIHGRASHPQTQGVVERYNSTIKEMLKNKFIEREKNNKEFVLSSELEIAVNI